MDTVKRSPWVISVLIIGWLAFGTAGCKQQAAQKPQTLEDSILQLRGALVKASPEVQSNLYNGLENGIRYGNYMGALVALDRITSDPGLDDQQKKLLAHVAELLKAKVQDPQNAAKPAQ